MYYLGFLKHNTKDVVIFKSIKAPKKGDFRYFLSVIGPYQSEELARGSLKRLQGYRENPSRESRISYRKKGTSCLKGHVHNGRCVRSENPLSESVARAVRLTKKIIRAYDAFRQENPGKNYHDQRFIRYMGELEKYKLGSPPYIATLAKAYDQLESAKDSQREKVG